LIYILYESKGIGGLRQRMNEDFFVYSRNRVAMI
jgi:hypothetical protein